MVWSYPEGHEGEYYSRHITYCEKEKIFEPTLRAKDYLCGPGTSCCMNMRVTEVMALDEGILVKPSCMWTESKPTIVVSQTRQNKEVTRTERETEGPGARVFSNIEEQPLPGKDICLGVRKRKKFRELKVIPQILEIPLIALEIQDPTEEHRWYTMWTPT